MHILKKRRAVGPPDDASPTLSRRDIPSVASSTASLTPSQMDSVVMNMLSITSSKGMSALCQGGDPVTTSGKRFQMLHVMGLTLVPVLVLLGLSSALFSIRVRDHLNNREIWKVLEHGVEISELIHNLQQERDLTCLYLSSISPKTKEFLVDLYPETDRSLDEIMYWDPTLSVEASGNAPEFYSKALLKIHLGRHRYQIENGRGSTTKQELDFYSRLIDILIGRFLTAVSDVDVGNSWRQLVAIQETVTAKESFGIERAYGTIFFTSGGFEDRADYLTFVEAQDVANASLDNARFYSDEVVNSMYVNITSGNKEFVATIRKMRHFIRSNVNTKVNGSWTQGRWWFNNMTNYLDILLLVQRNLTKLIEDTLDDQQANEKTMLIVLGTVFVVIGFVCPLILQSVYAATSDIQGYYISLVDRTKDINREKRRTDSLLYRLLPKPVAEQLKQNRTIVAESFSNVTIFFSDIVDFTTIAASCSPMQVVELLDTVYTSFDERIKLYRVYKMETIGDAYMVVSGLNLEGESGHAAEICTLALDLVDHIQLLEIPHQLGHNFKVRIGCHTGPVIAGVVGTKMPRYCLFGETVTFAKKMESTGMAGAIQISETTFMALKKSGGFVTEMRRDPPTGMQMNTYWLTHKVGMARFKLDNSNVHPSPETSLRPILEHLPSPEILTSGVQKLSLLEAIEQCGWKPVNSTSSREGKKTKSALKKNGQKSKYGKGDKKKGKEEQMSSKTRQPGEAVPQISDAGHETTRTSARLKREKADVKVVTSKPKSVLLKSKSQPDKGKQTQSVIHAPSSAACSEDTFAVTTPKHRQGKNVSFKGMMTCIDEVEQAKYQDNVSCSTGSLPNIETKPDDLQDEETGARHQDLQPFVVVSTVTPTESDQLSDETDTETTEPAAPSALATGGWEVAVEEDMLKSQKSMQPEVRPVTALGSTVTKPHYYILTPTGSCDSEDAAKEGHSSTEPEEEQEDVL